MNIQRTATITWIKYRNFGSFLQAFALQQAILNLGYSNAIIDDTSIPDPTHSIVDKIKKLILKFKPFELRKSHRLFHKATDEIKKLYESFETEHLIIDKSCACHQADADTKYDQFICGSDQIWCPILREHLEPFYYAGFTKKKRIAYAASFGVKEYPQDKIEEFKSLASDFYAISCRETIGCRFVSKILGIKAPYVVDPTLLIDSATWKGIAKQPACDITGEYLLTYFLSPNKWYLDCARQYSIAHNLKLVTFFLRPSSPKEADYAVSAGPSEFIYLIQHAAMFFTDSFHGSIFATHMETPFIAFKRFTGNKQGQNARLVDLYDRLGIPERFISNEINTQYIDSLPDQDFSHMKFLLKASIDDSIHYLRNSLKES